MKKRRGNVTTRGARPLLSGNGANARERGSRPSAPCRAAEQRLPFRHHEKGRRRNRPLARRLFRQAEIRLPKRSAFVASPSAPSLIRTGPYAHAPRHPHAGAALHLQPCRKGGPAAHHPSVPERRRKTFSMQPCACAAPCLPPCRRRKRLRTRPAPPAARHGSHAERRPDRIIRKKPARAGPFPCRQTKRPQPHPRKNSDRAERQVRHGSGRPFPRPSFPFPLVRHLSPAVAPMPPLTLPPPVPDRRLSSSGTIPSPCPALARIILLQSPFLSRGSSADRSRPQPREILTQKGDALSGHPLSFISVSAWRPDAPFQCFPAVAGQVRRSGTDASKRPPSHFPKETLRHDTGISAWQPECGQWLW